jgi:hypothetical protein
VPRKDSSLNNERTFPELHDYLQVACMQFVNIVVHSVEDMNFRVHLQYEFTKLGLDDYLEKLRNTESEELQVHQLWCEYKFLIIPLYEISSHSLNVSIVLIHSIPFFLVYLSHDCYTYLAPKITAHIRFL